MLTKTQLLRILSDQRDALLAQPTGIERQVIARIKEYVGIPHVVVITGLRRSGKSTLMRQIIKSYYNDSDFYYVNFEDERLLGFQAGEFNLIYEVLLELFGKQSTFFIDEIQAVPEFDRFIRRFYDSGFKFFISGSNASLLRLDISTRLTGRHVDVTLKPFSFPEFLKLRDVGIPDPAKLATEARVRMKTLFDEYLVTGGMPERLIYKREEIIDHIYDDIVIKDVAVRHGITDVRSLRELYQYLVANFCRKYSFNGLQKVTSVKSANTIKAYVGHLEDTYLAIVVPRFEYSVKKQIVAAKKFYVVDNGFVKRVSPTVTVDKGWLLENLVVATLHDPGNVFYYGRDKECDVVLKEGNAISIAIQVTRELTPENTAREVGGLVEAMTDLHLGGGIVITEDQEYELAVGGKRVDVVPAWRWALDPSRNRP
nr:ATP-binding protein [Candidatus Sigynarchaeum springense]